MGSCESVLRKIKGHHMFNCLDDFNWFQMDIIVGERIG